MKRALALAILGGCLCVCIVAGASLRIPDDAGGMTLERSAGYIWTTVAAAMFYVTAAWLVVRRPSPSKGSVLVVLSIALLARVTPFVAPPLLSTDLYRYVWDGRVQRARVNPYVYLPADPALAALRDAGTGPLAIYANINRADYAPTIYPPAAQMLFAGAAWLWPGLWGVKGLMLLLDFLACGAAMLLLRDAGLAIERVLIWAWNPLVIWELAGGGHIDAAAAGFSAVALLAAVRHRPGLAGGAIGLAVLCKFLPAALFPALWRRRSVPFDWRTPATCALVIAVGYACYAGAGWKVFGFLSGYAREEGLAGNGPFLLRAWQWAGPVPGWAGRAYVLVALTGLLALAARIAWRKLPVTGPARARLIGHDALWLGTATLVALSPHYPWYFAPLALPAVLYASPAVLWLTLAAPVLYLDLDHDQIVWPTLVFLPFAALLMLEWFTKETSHVPHA